MRLKGLAITFSFFALLTVTANASNNGLAVMDFLNIGVSARNAGTGEALAALSDGPIASYYNPSGLTTADNYQIAAMHSEWFQDLRYEFLGFAMPAGKSGNLGASFSYLSLGQIDGYSASNTATGSIQAFDWSLGLSYGHKVTDNLSLGAGAKVVNERLDDVSAYGYAGDLGAQYRTGRLDIGVALMNLGPNVKYDQAASPMPSRVETGIAYMPFGNELAFLTGVGVPFRGDVTFKAGLEYTYAGALVVRGGFDSAEMYDEQNGFSVGAGFKMSRHSIDYAYNANSVLGGTHQFSFVIRLGAPRETRYYSMSQSSQATGRVESVTIDPPAQEIKEEVKAEAKEVTPQPVPAIAPTVTYAEPKDAAPEPEAQITEPVPATPAPKLDVVTIPDVAPQSAETPSAPVEPVISAPAPEMPAPAVAAQSDAPKGKTFFYVCAGKYGNRSDAEAHKTLLEKLGFESKIEMVDNGEFRVILSKEKNQSKAENKVKEYKKAGVKAFVEER